MSHSLTESYTYCTALTKRTAGNFYYSFLTLSRERRRDMCALYAFMRQCDDLGDDESQSLEQRKTGLNSWRNDLNKALNNEEPAGLILPALVEVVHRYRIPSEYLLAVIDGVLMDLEHTGFATFEELKKYCYHVAGAVGLCCIHIWGFHDDRAIEAAIDCGLAFQLTNILRDLKEDSERNRIYLPQEDMQQFCYSADDLAASTINESFQKLMQFEVNRTKEEYQKANALFEYLDPPGRPILAAMLKIYGGLLNKIEQQNYNVFNSRIKLTKCHKLWITFNSIVCKR
ncbi:Phytoene synthase [hydrothermal vent metagenome]|uniref:Phytoene synthase n=1 Tax=hydrothermal vent metagenome TaxID=652676 RepID=A0A3B1DX24_9ZZZZ